jgi:hypothetical protein
MTTPEGDTQQLADEIARTRSDLGATVEALAAKTDVTARVKRSAADAAGRGRAQLAVARIRAAETAGTVRNRLATGTVPVREQARTLQTKAATAARRPEVRRKAAPTAAVIALVAGVIVLVVRRRRTS